MTFIRTFVQRHSFVSSSHVAGFGCALVSSYKRPSLRHCSASNIGLSVHRKASSVTMAAIERLADKLEAPLLDDRSYRVIRLPNKLEALLVHDPETDKASASVNVKVGSFSDADDMPGMAHAVEHLLFMGTKKVRLSLHGNQIIVETN